VYGACKGQFSRIDLRTGQEQNYWVGAQYLYGFKPNELKYRFQRVSPMEVSPHDPRVVYFGSQYVHRTSDGGVNWERISPDLTANDPSKQVISGSPITRDVTGEEYYSTLYAIRESPLEKGVIWAGANDGPIHVTRDNGKTWTDVTPKELPPGGRVQNIEPSPHRKGSAYVAVLRYLLGDFRPYIYRTDDYGKSWKLLTTGSNGIPADEPTRVVREAPGREGLLFAGTEFGAYVSFDNGTSWKSLQLGLPVTPITDMRIFRHDLVVSTQGRSFWILDDITPFEQLTSGIAAQNAHLFTPRTAFRFRYRGGRGGDPSAPQFPPAGAMIDYSLGARGARSVLLEVFDSNGKLVRRMASEATQADGQRAPDTRGARGDYSEVATTPGLHRVIWDLRYPGPWSDSEGGRGRGGPMAAPGEYTLKLTVDTSASGEPWTATTTLSVRADPRIVKAGVTRRDMEEQLAHNLRVRDALSEARRTAARVTAAVKRLDGATGSAADTLRILEVLDTALTTDPIRYSQPKLVDQLEYLYGMTTSADQRVGRDAVVRYRELEEELKRVQAKVTTLLGPPSKPAEP
jgi:hypothetical protein